MSFSDEALVAVLLIGLLAGSATGKIGTPSNLDLAGNLTVGLVGAFAGHWLLPLIHIHLGHGLISVVINAAVGSILLLLIVRQISSGRSWADDLGNRVSRGFERLRGESN
jgi:uncharacterized membrane protein YeaQ/YmgE (transglycosylase-associated protein family)